MTLKLYGYFIASGTQRVAVVLHEKNVPFELIPIDLTKGEQKSPEVKKYQPFGLTPYIVLVPLFAPNSTLIHELGRRRIHPIRE